MDECKFCRNVSYGKRAKEELDKGDGTQFIIFPINDGEILGAQRVDKAYVSYISYSLVWKIIMMGIPGWIYL